MNYNPNKVYIAYNAIPVDLITQTITYGKSQKNVRTNHTSWSESVVGVSGPIYLISITDELKLKLQNAIANTFPNFDLLSYKMEATYTLGGRYSFIPWHDDNAYKLAVTVYLNETWDKDWAGCLLYKEQGGEEIKAIYPEFNKAVLMSAPTHHTTVMPNIQAPLRVSLQLFFW
jgi:Rps23 Pro-64 3,4-dihydroxylase Tpa1-like proline 4-hydroxylase